MQEICMHRNPLSTARWHSPNLSCIRQMLGCKNGQPFPSWCARSAKVKSAGLCLVLSPTLELRAYRLAVRLPPSACGSGATWHAKREGRCAAECMALSDEQRLFSCMPAAVPVAAVRVQVRYSHRCRQQGERHGCSLMHAVRKTM